MRIRVPIDQIELINADLKRIDTSLAQNRALLNKAWSTILLESLVKVRINNTLLQSNTLAGRIQSSDAEMSNYLQRVVSSFIEADSRAGKFAEKIGGSLNSTTGGDKVSLRDFLLNSRKMYIAMALLGPVALVLPAVTSLSWVKERMAARNSTIPIATIAEEKPKIVKEEATNKQPANRPDEFTEAELAQLEIMNEDQFRVNLPDFVYDNSGYSKDINGFETYTFLAANGVVSAVYVWNKQGQISCTYYTLRKLRDRGLGYPFKQAGTSGGQWFDNSTDDVFKIRGNDALKEIIDKNHLPVKNIVVSFPNNPPVNGRTDYGHVVLIDEIDADGNIIFSDMVPSISDKYGSNQQNEVTLDQFVSMYSNNGNMLGAVIIGE